ncbi:DUF4158 domain-containing protein [Streptomyces geysiriensis]|nr:DUF4158 domain-containing protein [Streptomyces geysiriensis]MBX4173697.1 DUF4158 domain-containing protein [Streptomyces geysiriensis]
MRTSPPPGRCTECKPTAYEHTCEIQDAYEYHEHEDAEWSRRFRTFLHGWARIHAAGADGAFHQAVGWLRRHRVPLPGWQCRLGRCQSRGRSRTSGCTPASRAPAADADHRDGVRPRAAAGGRGFTASSPAAGALRPLRDPDAPELDEDEDESVGSE